MHTMAPAYARLIMGGYRTIDSVPDIGTLRADVITLLTEWGYQF